MTAEIGRFGSRMTSPPLAVDPTARYDDYSLAARAPAAAAPLGDAEGASDGLQSAPPGDSSDDASGAGQ